MFQQAVLAASESFKIELSIVEKDYYVTVFLQELIKVCPDIVFKGGTSLSKCYKIIERFSEDIDLTLAGENRPAEGQRKQLKKGIITVINTLNLELINADSIYSRRDYNKYVIDFLTLFQTNILKQHLIVETSVFSQAYPIRQMPVGCYIYDYLAQEKRDDIINEYELTPFRINVQSIERTFIDKLFAARDY